MAIQMKDLPPRYRKAVQAQIGSVTSKANVETVKPYYPYESKTESIWAANCGLVLAPILKGNVVVTKYHPVEFLLPGETYKVDFMHVLSDGRTLFVEVKGSDKSKNHRDAISKLRAAASEHPYWYFYEAVLENPKHELAWRVKRVSPKG